MKSWLSILSVMVVIGGVVVHATRGQVGGGNPPAQSDGGGVLRLPSDNPYAPAKPANTALPPYLRSSLPQQPGGAGKIADRPKNNTAINRDIEITPNAGPWTIFLQAYGGEDAPMMARKFVAVLREHYKLPAYVYNFGAKEKQEEYERVQKIRQEQIDALEKANLKADVPIRVSTVRIDEQTGVLIAGYRSFDDATAALKNTIQKLDPKPLIGNVDLDLWFVSKSAPQPNATTPGKVDLDGLGYSNPFRRAFAARNPSLPKEQLVSNPAEEMKFLQHVNRGEEFTLLKCTRPFTLVIKQYNMQHKTMANKKEMTGFIEKFNSLGNIFKAGEWQDVAAHNAHNLAEGFRKAGFPETYVLHCRYCSYVTMGNYDSLEDPRLIAMQNFLEARFKTDGYQRLELMPRPMPMPVPGIGTR
ncbi:MAG: hypothetical protein FJ303_27150 [Planctomycetes bacterium]|nr:hypothetical protein [Planctomycetota bacterium]